ncbi:hypothetical protein ACHWQZ_G008889 [Mnemiopsis leidyi]
MDDITTPDASSSSSEAGKRKRRYSESDGAAKKRQKRIDETPDERAICLEKDRIRKRLRRNSESELEREKRHLYPLEYIHTLIPSGVPPHELKLKKGCPIMLMRNFDPYKGHCNGTKYIVVNLHSRIIEAKIASGPYKDNVLFIPRIVIKPSESTFPFQLKRKQFPVRPCFAITANKSQGQTLGKVMAEIEETWKEWIDKYIKEFVIYIAKDPKDFFVSLMMIITPLLLLSAGLTYKYVQMLEKEEKGKKKTTKRKPKPRKDD